MFRFADMAEPARGDFGLEVTKVDRSGPPLALLGARSNYFMTAYYAPSERAPEIQAFWATGEANATRDATSRSVEDWFHRHGRTREDFALAERIEGAVRQAHHVWMTLRIPDGRENAAVVPLYVGPISRDVLSEDAYDVVEPVIHYPTAIDFVADALLGIYDLWLWLLGSAGMAVILMTLVVRGGLMPLSIKNQLMMRRYGRKIAKIKPKVDALRKRYPNNPKKLREEQMALYREHGVGFPMGCVMMLFQIPIFFALFSSLRVEYTLRNAAFLWIEDLSGPDALVPLGTEIALPVLGALMGPIRSINVLPLVYVGLALYQQRLMPKPMDEQQAQQMRMMKWLPVFFAVMLYNYTAALMLYMILSSVVAIVESKIVRRMDADASPPKPEPAPEPQPA
jgi:YidC/Oxa1 family membrane protein insertase